MESKKQEKDGETKTPQVNQFFNISVGENKEGNLTFFISAQIDQTRETKIKDVSESVLMALDDAINELDKAHKTYDINVFIT
jgi:hypothetical protein